MKFLAVWVLLFILAVAVLAGKLDQSVKDDPECPLVNCLPGSKVACFISPDRCQCTCVMDDDPCAPLLNMHCPYFLRLSCSIEAITCKCRCVPE
ncbi:uncharacterized protein LOC144149218 [Haemaphysalis longicornis]